VDQWLAREATQVNTRTLQELRSILKRSIARAQARGKVKRNVVLLRELPPATCVMALRSLWEQQAITRNAAGSRWRDNDLVFATRYGPERWERTARVPPVHAVKASLDGVDWPPRKMRHSFDPPGDPKWRDRDGSDLP
jgi:hypothetical protein